VNDLRRLEIRYSYARLLNARRLLDLKKGASSNAR
jgi:hypothetical protein